MSIGSCGTFNSAKKYPKANMSHQIKKNNFGPNPSSIIEIIILEALKYTYDKDLFILADSG